MVLRKINDHKYEVFCFQNGAVAYQNIRKHYKGKNNLVGLYLHVVFPGLKDDELIAFRNEIGVEIHAEYEKILRNFNGFKLFSDSLCLYGFGSIRENNMYIISRYPSKPVLFHMLDENNGKIDFHKMKIGSVCDDGLYIDNENGTITRINKSGDCLEMWSSLDKCLNELFDRLEKQYDSYGLCLKPLIINNLIFNRVKTI